MKKKLMAKEKAKKEKIKNFWHDLPRPFFVLAPMADVTDTAFREIIEKESAHGKPHGGPHVFWTEFVSADGLAHPIAQKKLIRDFEYTKKEHPIVAQIFGSNPENIKKAAALAKKMGFDGVDLNMGCPDRSIEKQGAGAAHIKDPNRAQEVIRAAQMGAYPLPVSVKTRVGYNKVEIADWIPKILEMNIAALTIHARTRKEMSLVPARWEHVKEVVEMARAYEEKTGHRTFVLGNGDVKNIDEAKARVKETGADGVMLGRAIFGNPWLFNQKIKREKLSLKERFSVMVRHTKLFEKKLGDIKNFAIMKKHFKAYVEGFEGAKELRVELMETKTGKEVEEVVKRFLKSTIKS